MCFPVSSESNKHLGYPIMVHPTEANVAVKKENEITPIRRTLLRSAPVEGLPGWETRLYMIEYSPRADGSGHHHPVVGLGYMLSGTILSAFANDEPASINEGESFVDAAHLVHTVSRNASATAPARFVIAYTVKQNEPVTVQPE